MLDGVEYQEEPLINGFCGDFYRAQNDLGSSPERQRESASLRSPAVRLGWPRIRFQTITSEYHRGERAGGAAGGKHRGEVGLGAALPTRTSGTTCAATSPTKI